jgi:hypothetical protein
MGFFHVGVFPWTISSQLIVSHCSRSVFFDFALHNHNQHHHHPHPHDHSCITNRAAFLLNSVPKVHYWFSVYLLTVITHTRLI